MLLRLAWGINKLGARASAAVVAAVRSSLLDCVLAMANKQRYAHQANTHTHTRPNVCAATYLWQFAVSACQAQCCLIY